MVTASLLLATLLAPAPASAVAMPQFFEKVLLTDDAGDFSGNGALDIDTVYVAELTSYDVDKDTSSDYLVIRISPTNMGQITECAIPTGDGAYAETCRVRYDLHFRSGGQERYINATVGGPGKPVLEESSGPAAVDTSSVRFLVDRVAYGLEPGTTLDHLYVTTDLVAAGPKSGPADRAPGDNKNAPYGTDPSIDGLYADPFTPVGVYPFFTVAAQTPTTLQSANGEPVRFKFLITPTAGVHQETIRIRFDAPKSWVISPSRGTTGISPTGLLTDLEENQAASFDFSASPNDVVNVGDVIPLAMRVYSASGGFQYVPVAVQITGDTFENPNYVFQLADSGPFRAGTTSHIVVNVLDAQGQALPDLPIDVVFSREGKRVGDQPATPTKDGYLVDYQFNQPGTWTLDASVRNLHPSPHRAFTVNVEKAHGAPGPELVALLGAVALAAFVGRKP